MSCRARRDRRACEPPGLGGALRYRPGPPLSCQAPLSAWSLGPEQLWTGCGRFSIAPQLLGKPVPKCLRPPQGQQPVLIGQDWSLRPGKPEGWAAGLEGGMPWGCTLWRAGPCPWRGWASSVGGGQGDLPRPGRPARKTHPEASHVWLLEGQRHLAVGEVSPGGGNSAGSRVLASF